MRRRRPAPTSFELDDARLKLREVQDLDWVVEETPDPAAPDYVAAEDARVFRPTKSRRHSANGPLAADWRARTLAATDKKKHPWICVYKLLTFEFKWFGIQTRAETFLVNWERNLFTKSQRLTWCLQDEWHDMSQQQIEEYLDTIAARINKQFKKASGAEESDTKQVTDGTAASTTTTAATDTADDKEKHHRHHHHHHSQHHHHHDSKGDEENEKEKSPTSKKTSSRRKKKRSTKANDAAAPAASSTADDDDNNASAEDDDAASASK
jgi:hypothetical protein